MDPCLQLEQAVAGVDDPASIFRTASLVLSSSGVPDTACHTPQQPAGHVEGELLHTALCAALSEPVLLSEAARRRGSSPLLCLSATESGGTHSSSSLLHSPHMDPSENAQLPQQSGRWAAAAQGHVTGTGSVTPGGWPPAAHTSGHSAAGAGPLARTHSATLPLPPHRSKRRAMRASHSTGQLMQLPPSPSHRQHKRRLGLQVSAEQQPTLELPLAAAGGYEALRPVSQGLQQLQHLGGSVHTAGIPSDALSGSQTSQLAGAQPARYRRLQLQEGAGVLLAQDGQHLLAGTTQQVLPAEMAATAQRLQQELFIQQPGQQVQVQQQQALLSPESAGTLQRLQDALRRCAERRARKALD